MYKNLEQEINDWLDEFGYSYWCDYKTLEDGRYYCDVDDLYRCFIEDTKEFKNEYTYSYFLSVLEDTNFMEWCEEKFND